jgi:hypothetical protein
MSLVEELESKVPKLNSVDVARFRDWRDRYVEDQLELRDDVKAKLGEAWKEIEAGNYRTCQTPPG